MKKTQIKTLDGGIILGERQKGKLRIYKVKYGKKIKEVTSREISLPLIMPSPKTRRMPLILKNKKKMI